jgi:hypothetical protein
MHINDSLFALLDVVEDDHHILGIVFKISYYPSLPGELCFQWKV